MLHAPFVMLALAGPVDECDLRATIAGDLMFLHQSGAARPVVEAAAQAARMPDFATALVVRVLAAEVSDDGGGRELAAYHFAADVHVECQLALAARR